MSAKEFKGKPRKLILKFLLENLLSVPRVCTVRMGQAAENRGLSEISLYRMGSMFKFATAQESQALFIYCLFMKNVPYSDTPDLL